MRGGGVEAWVGLAGSSNVLAQHLAWPDPSYYPNSVIHGCNRHKGREFSDDHSTQFSKQPTLCGSQSFRITLQKWVTVIAGLMHDVPQAACSAHGLTVTWSDYPVIVTALILQVKLVGPYLSCEIAVHIQAPFLVLDRYCQATQTQSHPLNTTRFLHT